MAVKPAEPTDDQEYKFQIKAQGDFTGSCLIININETQKKICRGCPVKKFRTGAEREVERLKGAFSGEDYLHKEMDGRNLDKEIKEYIENLGNKDSSLIKIKTTACITYWYEFECDNSLFYLNIL